MKKSVLITAVVVALSLGIGLANATLSPGGSGLGPLTPSAFCHISDDVWAFCDTSDGLGDETNPIASGYFATLEVISLEAATATISGVMSGNLDMDGNLILNIGAAGTDFTTGGGLVLSDNLGIGTTTANYTLDVWESATSGFIGVSSTTEGDIFEINEDGDVSIMYNLYVTGTSTLYGNIDTQTIESDWWLLDNSSNSLSIVNEGNNLINIDTTDANELITMGADTSIGNLEIAEDSGQVTLVDFPVSATPDDGTQESYDFQIDGFSLLMLSSIADSAGSVGTSTIRIGSSDWEVYNPTDVCIFDGYYWHIGSVSSGTAAVSWATSTTCD